MEFPDDADGNALRELVLAGSDLSRPLTIDFTIAIPTPEAGQAIAEAAEAVGYQVAVEQDAESTSWTCYCTRDMIASYEALIAMQEELNRLSEPHGGYCDGWGSFGNAAD
jgi:hypothetical protein